MLKKSLPYKIPKMMTTYPYNAFYFGVLEGYNIDYTSIIIRDYLELYYFKKDGINKIDFRKSGLLEKECFNVTEFVVSDDVVHTIIESLNNDSYAIVLLNQKHLINKIVSTTEEYVHDWMIFGYDDEKKYFLCTSYIHGKIKTIELTYCEVKNALINVPTKYIFPYPSYFRNHLVKINLHYSFPNIDRKFVSKNLLKAFFSKHFARDGFWHITTGLNTLFRLSRHFRIMSSRKKLVPIYIQNIGIMCDFRQNILLCLTKLNISKKEIQKYKSIQKQTHDVLLMAYKYNCNMQKQALNDICDIIDELNKIEIRMLLNVLFNSFLKQKYKQIQAHN